MCKFVDSKDEDHNEPHRIPHFTGEELSPYTYSNADHFPNSMGTSHPFKTKNNAETL